MSNPAHQPRPDFKVVEASRPEFDSSSQFRFTRSPNPTWTFGSGANGEHPTTPASHVAIDPYAEGRPPNFNYKLLISAIIPRPIAFVSTLSPDGKTQNLAPFSYFNFVNHDPPILVVGFASSVASAKDTLRNVLESKEAVINIISETFVEAANATAINAPYGVSEWDVAGLTPVYDCETVKAPRVKEAVFSVEVKLHSVTEFDSKSKPGQKSGTMCTFEGMRFWAREDAVNEERNILDPQVLRPISRLGGITYGRTTEGLEIPRPDFERDLGGKDGYDKLKKT
ncbi:flavin reductase like domain-containing protein [Sarocladium implicatum]|nr:flavin reductase like domain-containing protein [Sarocladium implicatum]